MPRYEIKFIGRALGAIGITYPITAVVEAEGEEQARLKLYDEYDCVVGAKVRRLPEKAERFTLTIQLGNDAMQTWGDIANALRDTARRIEIDHDVESGDSAPIHDLNGNRVGKWHTDNGA